MNTKRPKFIALTGVVPPVFIYASWNIWYALFHDKSKGEDYVGLGIIIIPVMILFACAVMLIISGLIFLVFKVMGKKIDLLLLLTVLMLPAYGFIAWYIFNALM